VSDELLEHEDAKDAKPQEATAPAPLYFSGLDLGQVSDYTALAVLERTPRPDPDRPGREAAHYAVRHLWRPQLGTPYTDIAERLKELFAQPPLADSMLTVDGTGVGRPVVDMIKRAGIKARIRAINITAGMAVTSSGGGFKNVPKRSLVGVLQVLLQSRRLKIASGLPHAQALAHELQNFRVKVSIATGNESFEAWRERDHDDLVLAVACAAWEGERYAGPWRLEVFERPDMTRAESFAQRVGRLGLGPR
jgi:hypothetical protein